MTKKAVAWAVSFGTNAWLWLWNSLCNSLCFYVFDLKVISFWLPLSIFPVSPQLFPWTTGWVPWNEGMNEWMNSHLFPLFLSSAWFASASRHFLFRVCTVDNSLISWGCIFVRLSQVLWRLAPLQTRLNNHQCQNRLQHRWKSAGSSTVICATLSFHSFIQKTEFNILSKLYRTHF